jgi:hypothetical protein
MACPLHIYSLTGQEGLVELFLAFGLVGRQHLQGVVVLLLHSCAERWAFFYFFMLFFSHCLCFYLLGFFSRRWT